MGESERTEEPLVSTVKELCSACRVVLGKLEVEDTVNPEPNQVTPWFREALGKVEKILFEQGEGE
jgi:hypothetical protein